MVWTHERFTDCHLRFPGAGIVADALRLLYVPAVGCVCLRHICVYPGAEERGVFRERIRCRYCSALQSHSPGISGQGSLDGRECGYGCGVGDCFYI